MDIQAMMKQAQELQAKMQEAKQEIDNSEFTSTQGGVVTVVMYGTKMISAISIADDAMDDKEMLEDLIMLACNDCCKQIDDYTNEKMGAFAPGLGGMF